MNKLEQFETSMNESDRLIELKKQVEEKINDILDYTKYLYFVPPYILNKKGVFANNTLLYHSVKCIREKFGDARVLFFGTNYPNFSHHVRNLGKLPGSLSGHHCEAEFALYDAFIIKSFTVSKSTKIYKNQQMLIEYAVKANKPIIFIDDVEIFVDNVLNKPSRIVKDVCPEASIVIMETPDSNFAKEMEKYYNELFGEGEGK